MKKKINLFPLIFFIIYYYRSQLSFEEITTVKRNLQTNNSIDVDNELIRETWHPVYRRHFLQKALGRCYDCRRGFFMYSKGIENDVSIYIEYYKNSQSYISDRTHSSWVSGISCSSCYFEIAPPVTKLL